MNFALFLTDQPISMCVVFMVEWDWMICQKMWQIQTITYIVKFQTKGFKIQPTVTPRQQKVEISKKGHKKKVNHYKPNILDIKIHSNLFSDLKFPAFFKGCK